MMSTPDSTSTDRYRPGGRARGFRWAAAIAAVLAIAAIAVVVSGGEEPANDPIGDVRLVEGKQPRAGESLPIPTSVADISEAAVSSQGSTVLFEVTAAADIPGEFERSSLEFRFEISESARPTWIVTGSVNVSATAALVSQTSDYTATTIDDSFPGEVEISGRTLTIAVDPSQIDDFPEEFEWVLTSNLIAFRDVTGSTRAEDRLPDEGDVGF